MITIKKFCLNCNNEFTALLKEHNRGNAKFCSISCSSIFRGKTKKSTPNTICSYCNNAFYRTEKKKKLAKHGHYFCSKACKDKAQTFYNNPKRIDEIMPSHFGSSNGTRCYRNIAFRSITNLKCERCNYNTHPQILHVHHKDRNRNNNNIDNLEILCPNCHETDHFLNSDGKWWTER